MFGAVVDEHDTAAQRVCPGRIACDPRRRRRRRQRHDGGRGKHRSGGLSHGDWRRQSDQRDRETCQGEGE
jgi:hypothetical protein